LPKDAFAIHSAMEPTKSNVVGDRIPCSQAPLATKHPDDTSFAY
jgi:hypothetical protein